MKKNGFTLIELLAVIVILAIIALIATPAVLNIIEDSKKAAAERSTEAVVKAAEIKYMAALAKGESVTTGTNLDAKTLDVDNAPTGDSAFYKVEVDANNNVTVTASGLVFDSYTCSYTTKAECTKN